MQTPERSPSPENPSDEFLDYPPPHSLPFPSGTYTLLPLIERADNGELPSGPWQASDLKKRWEQHVEKEKLRNSTKENGGYSRRTLSATPDSSAVDDDEEDDEDEDVSPAQATLDHEFIVPFFVQLPSYTPPPSSYSQSNTPRRRSSSTRSSSFTPMTPIPSLRSSSPTSSHPQESSLPRSLPPAQPIGFLRPPILLALLEDNQKLINMNSKPVWKFLPSVTYEKVERRPSYGSRPGSRRHSIKSLSSKPDINSLMDEPTSAAPSMDDLPASRLIDSLRSLELGKVAEGTEQGVWAVGFEDWVNEEGIAIRNEHLDRIVRGWKMSGKFMDQLAGWRDEQYIIYGPVASFKEEENPLPGSNVAFRLERAACSLFGVTTFGVHSTAYVEEEGEPLKLWVPRRSATKATWPSYLDNTVAGGITAGDLPRQSILREFSEEASLPPQIVSPLLRQAGVVTYCFRQKEGWLQPEVQYVYDIKLPSDGSVRPTTNPEDGEVESFELMELEQVVRKMVEGEFKPNCALVLIDFFIRHGLLTAENDVRFLEVSRRIHRELGLPGPA